MGLRENKLYFENEFFTKWALTPIHYAGQEFSADGIGKWINPVYHPLSARINGLSKFGNFDERGSLDVTCWARTDADAMELSDAIIKFVGDNVNGDKFRLSGYQVADHAWDDTGLVYLYLSFDVVSYICDTPAQQIIISHHMDDTKDTMDSTLITMDEG